MFEEYSNLRNKDAEAVCDLSMYNYLEVNDLYFQPRPQSFLHFLRWKSHGDEAEEEWCSQLVVWIIQWHSRLSTLYDLITNWVIGHHTCHFHHYAFVRPSNKIRKKILVSREAL